VFYGLLDAPDYGGEHANLHHRRIVQALEDGDAARVRQMIVEDLVAAGDALRPRLGMLVVPGAEAGVEPGSDTTDTADPRLSPAHDLFEAPQSAGRRKRAAKAVVH
jgi:hypothetical protein